MKKVPVVSICGNSIHKHMYGANLTLRKPLERRAWWNKPVISALRKLKQKGPCEHAASREKDQDPVGVWVMRVTTRILKL